MNVLLILITVMLMLHVPIRLEVSFVHVKLDIQEMDSPVQVCGSFYNILHHS